MIQDQEYKKCNLYICVFHNLLNSNDPFYFDVEGLQLTLTTCMLINNGLSHYLLMVQGLMTRYVISHFFIEIKTKV